MQDKRELIYEAAMKLFNEIGFDKTPTSQIAKEAGVAVGTLFHHFSTKEELVNALFLRCKDSYLLRVRRGLSDTDDFKGRVRCLFLNSVSWAVEFPGQYLFFTQYHNSRYILEGTHEAARQRFEPLLELVMEGVTDKELKPIPLDLLSSLAWSIITATSQHIMQHPELLQDEAFMETTLSCLWDSLHRA